MAGIRRDARILLAQLRFEQRSFWRNPASAVFTIAFPVLFLVVLATVFKGTTALVGGRRVGFDDYYIPALVAFGVLGACFTNIAMTLSIRRDGGLLKRLRGTPLPAGILIGGLICSAIVVSLVLVVVTAGVGIVAYGVRPPAHPLALALALAVGTICLCSLGVAMSGLVPNADAAPAVVNGVVLPLVFVSGTFFPIAPDSVFGRIAAVFPLRHFIAAVYDAFDPARQTASGLSVVHLGVMAGWAVAGFVVAARTFQWEPRRRT